MRRFALALGQGENSE